MRKLRSLLALVMAAFLSLPSFGWWETGHRTVARIAAAHLTPAARTRVAQIFEVADTPEAVADAMALASTWPDETKKQTKTDAWHYVDLTLQDKKKDLPKRCPEQNCITDRIELFERQLAGKTTGPTDISELDALRYLIHFVGDVHQPLHTISDADLGGNCEQIEPFERAKNLHALWDGGLVNALSPDDKELAARLDEEIQRHRVSGKWSKGNAKKWTWESHQLAKREVYQRLNIPLQPVVFPPNCAAAPVAITGFRPDTNAEYISQMKPIVEQQLEKGGLRLARVLNQIFR